MKQPTISKRDLFLERYFKIFRKEKWLEIAENEEFFAYRINSNQFAKEQVIEILKQNNVEKIYWLNYHTLIFPISLKETVSHLKEPLGIILNPSSLLPPLNLKIENDYKILDMCAAPGIKSSQIYLRNLEENKNIELESTEIDSKRFVKMKNVFSILGIEEKIKSKNIDARKLSGENLYDSILLDAPCSAEGELIQSQDYSHWSAKLINSYTNSQKALLAKAITLVKTGGEIIYSTCTLAPEENEEIVDWALKRFPIQIERINLPDWKEYSPQVLQGITSWNKKEFSPEVQKTVRIVPDNIYEGFFIAKIRKI